MADERLKGMAWADHVLGRNHRGNLHLTLFFACDWDNYVFPYRSPFDFFNFFTIA